MCSAWPTWVRDDDVRSDRAQTQDTGAKEQNRRKTTRCRCVSGCERVCVPSSSSRPRKSNPPNRRPHMSQRPPRIAGRDATSTPLCMPLTHPADRRHNSSATRTRPSRRHFRFVSNQKQNSSNDATRHRCRLPPRRRHRPASRLHRTLAMMGIRDVEGFARRGAVHVCAVQNAPVLSSHTHTHNRFLFSSGTLPRGVRVAGAPRRAAHCRRRVARDPRCAFPYRVASLRWH